MRCLIFADPGSDKLRYVVPSDWLAGVFEENEEWALAELAKGVPSGVPFREGDTSELPPTKAFRNAWVYIDEAVAVDMPKARMIHLARIRDAREPLLRDLDRQWMRATGQAKPLEAAAIESKRQALRDLPQTVNLAQFMTPEALAAFWPEELD